jgi:hypothetical protein
MTDLLKSLQAFGRCQLLHGRGWLVNLRPASAFARPQYPNYELLITTHIKNMVRYRSIEVGFLVTNLWL